MAGNSNMRPLPHLWRKRTTRLERWSNVARIAWARLWDLPPPVRLASVLMLLVLGLLLTACAAPSTPSSEPARNPQVPPVSQSQPSQTYSASALANIARWQKLLIGTLPTP